MARISTYIKDGNLSFDDKVIGTDADNSNATVNFTLDQLGEFYSKSGRAQSSITFTFDVGTPYMSGGTPPEVLPGHIYFNSSDWVGLTEAVFSTTTNLGVQTRAFAGVIYDQAIAINRTGTNRGEAYGFFDVADTNHDLVYIQGEVVGYRVAMQGFVHPNNHPEFVNYQGSLPSDNVSLTPFGVADIIGTEQNLIYTASTGVLEITDGNEQNILGIDTTGTDPAIVHDGTSYFLGHSNLDVEGDGIGIDVTDGPNNGERLVSLTTSVSSAIESNTTHRQTVTGNPHMVTKADVGLSDVDNTSDVNKPVSTAQAAALALKQDIISDISTIRDNASGALQRSGGTMTGDIVFSAGQTFPGTTGNEALNDITDVTLSNVQDNQVLKYDQSSQMWINDTDVAGTTTNTLTDGNGITDFTFNGVSAQTVSVDFGTGFNQVLRGDTTTLESLHANGDSGQNGMVAQIDSSGNWVLAMISSTPTPSTHSYALNPSSYSQTVGNTTATIIRITNVITGHTALFSNTQHTLPGFTITPNGATLTIIQNSPTTGVHHLVPNVVLTDTSDSSQETVAERSVTITIDPVPASPFYYGEFSSINTPEFLEVGHAGFTNGGALVSPSNFELTFLNNGEWAIVDIADAITITPTFTADGGITLRPDHVFKAPTNPSDPDYDAASVGYSSYWLAMAAGTHNITIRF